MQSSFLPVLDQMTVIKIPVHLSRHILQNATLNSEEIYIEKEQKQKKRHRVNVVTVKTTKHSKEEDDEKELEKQRIKEERYGRIMDDLKSLRDHYKHQYVKALTVKVNKQKKEFKEKESHMEEKLKVKEESEKRKRAEEKEMIAKGELKSNCKFKKKLKKTEYQKIIRLENKLKKQGFLNKAYEMKEFWDIVSVPGNLQKVLKEEVKWEVIKSYHRIAAGREIMVHIQENGNENENNNLVSPTCKAQNKNQGMPSFKPMTPVPEEEAVEKPKSACNKVVQGTRNKHPKQPVQSERNASLSLEQRFPKIEFPPLAAYRLMLGSDEADPDEERRQAERQQRLTSRQEHQCTINKMFTRALVNKAATQRLLQKRKAHGLDTLVNVSSVKEIVVSQPIKEKTLVPLQTSRSSENSQRGKGSTSASSKSRKKRPVSNTSKVSLSTMDMLSDSEEESEEEEKFPVLPPPLAMEHLLKSCKIKEAIRPSSFWINPAFQDQAPLSQETEPLTQVVFKDSQVIPSQRVNLFERNSTLVGQQQVVNL